MVAGGEKRIILETALSRLRTDFQPALTRFPISESGANNILSLFEISADEQEIWEAKGWWGISLGNPVVDLKPYRGPPQVRTDGRRKAMREANVQGQPSSES